MADRRILQNQLRCDNCGDTPYSAHRHDYKACKCGRVAVDGGMSYLRRRGALRDSKDMSITIDEGVYAKLVEALQWAGDTERNELGTICAIFRVLRDSGYDLMPEEPETYEATEVEVPKGFLGRLIERFK